MTGHALTPSTHTVELAQIEEINAALGTARATTRTTRRGEPATPALTAESLALDGAHGVPASAALEKVMAEGSPTYPYVYGQFAGRPVPLHTEQLRAISRALDLHHRWGV